MPVLRLEPMSNDAPGPGMGFIGAPTAWEALADSSDASYVTLQVTEFEPTKAWKGELTNLPDGAGVVVGVIVNVRAARTDEPGDEQARLRCGDDPNARVTNDYTPTITDYASVSLTDLDVAECNAARWMAGADWITGSVANCRIYKMNFDVDFNYVTGVTVAMILQWLGPLVAVGLYEMPRLALELRRRSGILLRRHELEAAWREMREHRARRHFLVRV
jgi:hypothetical protein